MLGRLLSKYWAAFMELMAFLIAPAFGVEAVAGLVPDTDGEHGVEWNCLALHQRVDFLLLFSITVRRRFSFRWRSRRRRGRVSFSSLLISLVMGSGSMFTVMV